MEAWNDAARLSDRKWERIFGQVIPEAQRHIAGELNLPDPSTIAFAPSTHELLVRIFSARAASGPIELLTTDGEFHSFRRQSARWEEEGRIRRTVVTCEPFETFNGRFLAAAKQQQFDVAFLSAVMFRTGLRFDGAAELAKLARPDGPWVVLDLYHSFMALPSDFAPVAANAFLLGGGYKYAMAGEGAAYIHAPPGYASAPSNTGWFAEFSKLEAKQDAVGFSTDAMRFMGATFDATGVYRFNAVRRMLEAEGLSTTAICEKLWPLRTDLGGRIEAGEAGRLGEAEILRPNRGPQPRFLALRHPDAVAWRAKLLAHDIITDARDDVLRIGLGLYHDEEDMPAFCAAAKKALD
jgi:selenocysteine lyase/cysteine desulfurase